MYYTIFYHRFSEKTIFLSKFWGNISQYMKKTCFSSPRTGLFVLLIGIAAGVVNGLFGTGGGILIFFFLSRLYRDSEEYSGKDVFAMTVFCVFLMSVSALFRYTAGGYAALADVKPYLLPAGLGGLFGAFLLGRLRLSAVKRIFAILVIYAGMTMLLR